MEIINGIAVAFAVGIIAWLLKMYRDNATKSDLSGVKTAMYMEIETLKESNQALKMSIELTKKDVINNREKHDEAIDELKQDFKEVKNMIQELLNRK